MLFTPALTDRSPLATASQLAVETRSDVLFVIYLCSGPSHRGRGTQMSRGRGGGTPRGGQT